ncbi:MAG: hypothetical protein LBK00_05795 [Treponema sp.]|nr:hypothetical protein [Treponema sp.]
MGELDEGSTSCFVADVAAIGFSMIKDKKRRLTNKHSFRYTVGIMIGDKIRITSGSPIGTESLSKKIDRHGHNATLELTLLGALRNIMVALEITAKI